jgi:hypothetical protein
MICALPFLMLVPVLPGRIPTPEEIMCRVAENQERAEEARKAYVYDMNVFVRMKRANGKLAREESRDYVVAPDEKGAKRKLVKLAGKILDGGREITYTTPRYEHKNIDIDSSLTDAFAREVMWRKSEIGPMVDWFPLTRARLAHYTAKFEGEERYRDYDVYKVSFAEHEEEECWTGEALIEKNEFQPVLVTNQWACRIPAAVKIVLGTNITQVGAKITYQRFDKDVWFPVTCGGELKLRVLFMYARTIAFSAKNADFRKADVQTSIQFECGADASGCPASEVFTPRR